MAALTNGVVQPISGGYFKILPETRLTFFGVRCCLLLQGLSSNILNFDYRFIVDQHIRS
jgi:hypothetical protein